MEILERGMVNKIKIERLAEALRWKLGTNKKYTLDEMVDAIKKIGTEWLGRLYLDDTIEGKIQLEDIELTMKDLIGEVDITTSTPEPVNITDTVSTIKFEIPEDYFNQTLVGTVVPAEIIYGETMDAKRPGTYNPGVIFLDDDKIFRMISNYRFVSSAQDVDYGRLQVLDINDTQFETVESEELSYEYQRI